MRFDRRLRPRMRMVEVDEDERIADDVIDDIERDVKDELDIEGTLYEIGDNLGYDFTTSNGYGTFSISDNVEVSVRYTPKKVYKVQTVILKNPAKFDCTKNTTTVDNLSVELQTCVLLIKEIKQKLL